jgi:ligand-binding sensor domain-containing protein
MTIHKDQKGIVWLGGWEGGLEAFDETTEQFSHYMPDPDNPNSLISDRVLSLLENPDGSLWVGQQGGLSLLNADRTSFTNYLPDSNNPYTIGAGDISSLFRDRAGSMWLGTWQGVLMRFDDKTKTFINYLPDADDAQKMHGGSIYALHEDQQGLLWIGSADGLYQLDRATGVFTRYTETEGLPSLSVVGILEDTLGQLWLSTRNGLYRFNPRTMEFKNFSISDGLQGNDFSETSYTMDNNGEMLFGGSNGINRFVAENIKTNTYVPPVVMTEFKVFNKHVPIAENSLLTKSIAFTEALTLSYLDDVFSFEFAALSYANSNQNQYRYKLEGLEPEWNEVDSRHRLAIYTNLDPGRYVFEFKARIMMECGTAKARSFLSS